MGQSVLDGTVDGELEPRILRYLEAHVNYDPPVELPWETPYLASSFPGGEDWWVNRENVSRWAEHGFHAEFRDVANLLKLSALDECERFLLRLDLLTWRRLSDQGQERPPLVKYLRAGREHWGAFAEDWRPPTAWELERLDALGGYEGGNVEALRAAYEEERQRDTLDSAEWQDYFNDDELEDFAAAGLVGDEEVRRAA